MTQYLVIGVNQDEFGRGTSRPVNKFESEADMLGYVATYNGNASLLEIYKATPLSVKMEVSEVTS